ncbi:MAG: galactokinase, partial [Bryobacteraceae bacterium]
MIITSSPLRISLGGGGTDLPSYYREHTGFVISAAINKYVYITLHESFSEGIIVKYSKMETVQTAGEIKHPIVREAL